MPLTRLNSISDFDEPLRRLVNLAEDIVTNGLDPTTLTVVVATGDRRKRYKVLEGNRRVLALKSLETPAIVISGLAKAEQRRLGELSVRYLRAPIDAIECVLFDNEEEAFRWIEIRHTGANDGVGLVEWDSNQQDRFRARHGASAAHRAQIWRICRRRFAAQRDPAGKRGSCQREDDVFPHAVEDVRGRPSVVSCDADARVLLGEHDPELAVDAVHAPGPVAGA
jgi:hypothetical protein